MGLDSR
ncbi:hypothetical protein LINPERHAP2_LOCUS40946 [Linum perenne]